MKRKCKSENKKTPKPEYDTQVVIVHVEGGLVQDVECPKGVKVIVKDYDVEGSDEAPLEDANGEYIESVYEG